MKTFTLFGVVCVAVVAAATSLAVNAADPVATSKTDREFVGKVSQGGSFEVLASQLAAEKAMSPAVKSFAQTDVDDHVKVNDELKSIAAAQGLPVASTLKPALQKKFDQLGALSGAAFDRAYVGQMSKIHQKDEAIFAKEAKAGTSDDWKRFAAKTDQIVKGHIAALVPIQSSLK